MSNTKQRLSWAFTASLLTFSTQGRAACLGPLLGELDYTYSAEIEIDSLQVKPTAMRRTPVRDLINDSPLYESYWLHGKDKNGQWVEGLVPEEIIVHDSFEELGEAIKPVLSVENESLFLHVKNIPAKYRTHVLFRLFSLQEGNDNAIRLSQRAGTKPPVEESSLPLLPDVLAFERAQDGTVLNIEFPMKGYTRDLHDIERFLKGVFFTMGWEKSWKDSNPDKWTTIDIAFGHVHQADDSRKVEPSKVQAVLEGKKRKWGDLNSLGEIQYLAKHANSATAGSEAVINKIYLQEFVNVMNRRQAARAMTILTRRLYESVAVTDRGLAIANEDFTQPQSDFPSVYKHLRVGLRAIYGPRRKAGEPAPITGLELRELDSQTSFETNVRIIRNDQFNHAVDIDGPRGFFSSADEALQSPYVREIEGAESVLRRIEEYCKNINVRYESERTNCFAIMSMPFNNLISYPSIQYELQMRSVADQQRLMDDYNSAKERFRKSVASLASAIQNQGFYSHSMKHSIVGNPATKDFRELMLAIVAEFMGRSPIQEMLPQVRR